MVRGVTDTAVDAVPVPAGFTARNFTLYAVPFTSALVVSERTGSAPPVTATGVVELAVVPLASCPPQQEMVPSDNNAHVCNPTALMLVTVLPASAPPVIATGVVESTMVPLPSCPWVL